MMTACRKNRILHGPQIAEMEMYSSSATKRLAWSKLTAIREGSEQWFEGDVTNVRQ